MAFRDKDLASPGPITVDGRHLKRYHVDQPERLIEPEVEKAAYDLAAGVAGRRRRRRHPGRRVGGAAPGRDTGAYLLAYTWVWDNALEVRVAAAGQPALDCPDHVPSTSSTSVARPWAASGSWRCWSTNGPPGSGTCLRRRAPPDWISARHASGRAGGPLMGDFDFFVGTWNVVNRRLRERLGAPTSGRSFRGCRSRTAFSAAAATSTRSSSRPRVPRPTVRIFDPAGRCGRSTG